MTDQPTIAGVMLKMIEKEEVMMIAARQWKSCTRFSGDKNKEIYKEGYYDGFRDALNRLDNLIKMQTRSKL